MTFVPSSLFSDLSLHTVLEDESLIAAAVADIKAHFFSHLAFRFHVGVGERGQSDAGGWQREEIHFIDLCSYLFDKDNSCARSELL